MPRIVASLAGAAPAAAFLTTGTCEAVQAMAAPLRGSSLSAVRASPRASPPIVRPDPAQEEARGYCWSWFARLSSLSYAARTACS